MKKNPFRENREREKIVRNIFLLMKQRMLISMLVSKTYTRLMILKHHKLEIRDKEEKKEKILCQALKPFVGLRMGRLLVARF